MSLAGRGKVKTPKKSRKKSKKKTPPIGVSKVTPEPPPKPLTWWQKFMWKWFGK